MNTPLISTLLMAALCFVVTGLKAQIWPYAGNPHYWELDGKPVVLLGASDEDNLYQMKGVKKQLDALAAAGGNYVRCTMSCRDEGDAWWFEKDPQIGLYDLEKPGEEHWKRFEQFLEMTSERGIVVQIEVWDRFDFAREPWQLNPYNPKNNSNYTGEDLGLKEDYAKHPSTRENPFFRTVPALENNEKLLRYQHLQVDKLLSISLRFNNVLYCMDNETNESPEWGKYWSNYIKVKAREAGVPAMTTEMWDDWNLHNEEHKATLDHPETYAFADISQNNHQVERAHWDNPQAIREYVMASGYVRPLNSVKIYGANSGRYGTTRDAQERFWRNILGGLASSRFHRPPAGLGLNEITLAHIRSMRMALAEHDIFRAEPRIDVISENSANEAYCSAIRGESYLLFFPDGGDVLLRFEGAKGQELTIRWLDIRKSKWSGRAKPLAVENGRARIISPREEGYWAAVVTVVE